MTREAINLTMSEPLRRAQVPQRLDALAKITGLAQAQLAGRALTIGLGHIEKDLSQIFPGVADKPSPIELSSPAPSMGGRSEAQPGAATQRMEAQRSAPSSTPEPEPAPPPLAAHGAPLPQEEKPDPAPQHPEPPRPESTKILSTAPRKRVTTPKLTPPAEAARPAGCAPPWPKSYRMSAESKRTAWPFGSTAR